MVRDGNKLRVSHFQLVFGGSRTGAKAVSRYLLTSSIEALPFSYAKSRTTQLLWCAPALHNVGETEAVSRHIYSKVTEHGQIINYGYLGTARHWRIASECYCSGELLELLDRDRDASG